MSSAKIESRYAAYGNANVDTSAVSRPASYWMREKLKIVRSLQRVNTICALLTMPNAVGFSLCQWHGDPVRAWQWVVVVTTLLALPIYWYGHIRHRRKIRELQRELDIEERKEFLGATETPHGVQYYQKLAKPGAL